MRKNQMLGAAAIAFVAQVLAVSPVRGDAVEARLAALESRVTALEDVEHIERLFRAYGYYFDKGLWKETTTLFTDDGVVEIAQRGIYRGHGSIERLFVQLFGRGKNCLAANGLNNHIILQPIMTVNADGKSATGRARIIGTLAVNGSLLFQEGLYNLKFSKSGGIWRISYLHYFGDIYMRVPDALKTYSVPQSAASAQVPPDAPPSVVYQSYPGYYVPEFPYPNPVTGKVVEVGECNAHTQP